MLPVTVDPLLQQRLPTMLLGLLEAANLRIETHHPALWTMLEELCERLRFEWKGKVAADRPEIAATRRAYRAIGDDPTRYRPANEALLRRVLSNRALSKVNTVVDINNYVSLESGFAMGCYDLDQVSGPMVVRVGAAGEQYAPIGKPAVDAENRLVLADEHGIVGSPTADAQHTMVTPGTTHVLFAIFAFETNATAAQASVNQTARLLTQFCGATIVDQHVLAAQAHQSRGVA